jgi:hypothetical protein
MSLVDSLNQPLFDEPFIEKLIIPRQLENTSLNKGIDGALLALGTTTAVGVSIAAGGSSFSKFLHFLKKML